MGVDVRHAIQRALATANLAPRDATFKVVSARAWINRRGRVARGEVSLVIREPRPLGAWEPHELEGWTNPDGEHPGMVFVRLADPLFVDAWPATTEQWRADHPRESVPPDLDPDQPWTGPSLEEAADWAARRGARLPTAQEFRQLWGPAPLPWGSAPDPRLGLTERRPYDPLPRVGQYPPQRGLFDLGAWLWQWLEDGRVAGVAPHGAPRDPEPGLAPIGVRCVADPDLPSG